MSRKSRAKFNKVCASCSKKFFGSTESCSHACANKLRTASKNRELDDLRAESGAIYPTVSQVAKLRKAFEDHGIKPSSQELTIVQMLPPKLRKYWFGLPEGHKGMRVKIVFAEDFSTVRCPPCGKWLKPGQDGFAYCSQKCCKGDMSRVRENREADQIIFAESITSKGYSRFTAKDVAAYMRINPKSAGESVRVARLMEKDPGLASKYLRLRARTSRGRHYLARGGKDPRCEECRKLYVLGKMLDSRFCSSKCFNRNDGVKAKKSAVLMEKFGCSDLCRINKSKNKIVRLGKRKVSVQGYEPQAIAHILGRGVNPNRIRVGTDVPIVPYKIGRRDHKFFPDMLVGDDLIVEVKSDYTFAVSKKIFRKNAAKAKAVKAAGYRFRMLVMTRSGRRVVLPADWPDRTYGEVRASLRAKTYYPKNSPSD